MKKSIFILVTILAITISCSSPLDKKYSKDTLKEDIQKIVENKSVDTLGMQVLMGIAMADAFGANGQLEGKTYREIIDEVKKETRRRKGIGREGGKRRSREN